MIAQGSSPIPFDFSSGRLCLDFSNTVKARPTNERVDLISNYTDLLEWSRQATILTPGEAATLAEEALRRTRQASEALTQSLAIREVIYTLFSALAAGLPAPPGDLRTLNRAIGRAMSHAGLSPSAGRFRWSWPDAPLDLDRVSWWVSRSAAELLVSSDITCVRECAGYDCGWLFMDVTKNRSRRWCNMGTCGNRAKSRRHYERQRAAGQARRRHD